MPFRHIHASQTRKNMIELLSRQNVRAQSQKKESNERIKFCKIGFGRLLYIHPKFSRNFKLSNAGFIEDFKQKPAKTITQSPFNN